ncbi:hypothetical protein [Thiolinea disciformis]|uniref:hypothetical protein n=1 Tax=Thiolinea disciformis TaxID=125614 RepID=UPI00036E2A34|nr:hypothetical protein [Thiolinea disciformis]
MKKLLYSLALLLCLLPNRLAAFSPTVEIHIAGKWRHVSQLDVKAVLDSAVTVAIPYVGARTMEPIQVRNHNKGPISLYERSPAQEYVVLLDIDGAYYAQMAYQFSHEYCHLRSNYDLAPHNITRQQWFEEALCEAFSLFNLEQMAKQWESHPPYPSWKAYAPELKKYVASLKKEQHRRLAPSLKAWYEMYRNTLEENPYAQNRQLNEQMASHLLGLFEKYPQSWQAINYVNLGEITQHYTFSDYLNDWLFYTPTQWQQPIRELLQELGFEQKYAVKQPCCLSVIF